MTDPNPPMEMATNAAVRVERSGPRMALEWGRAERRKSQPWMVAVLVLGVILALAAVITAGIVEGSNNTMADIIGFSGLGIGGLLAVFGAGTLIRARGGLGQQGRITATETTIETSLRVDPHAQNRAQATDSHPHFRTHLERHLIARVGSQPFELPGIGAGRMRRQVVATTKSGVDYVLAVGCSDGEADEIVHELRAHLELPSGPLIVSEADSDEALAELHDAVTDYRKGPTILPEEVTRLED